MKRLTALIGISLTFAGVVGFLSLSDVAALTRVVPLSTFATSAAANEACNGIGLLPGGGCGNGQQVGDVLNTVITIFSAIVGIIAVIMIIVAGLQFITSNGDPQNVSKARMSLIYAIIGIVIVIAAQTIVHFAISQAKT